jgi:putative tricarboxylic transport membrane protein
MPELIGGFETMLRPDYLLFALIGVFLGTAIGVLPGIGPIATISLLLPFTFQLDGLATLVMLSGIYFGAQYGGSTTAILVNVPGSSTSVVATFEGYPMAKQGRAGPALAITTVASFLAGTVTVVFLMLLAPGLVPIALAFGPREDFALMILAFALAAGLAGGNAAKSFISLALGMILAMVGLDPITAQPRFTMGVPQLVGGIQIVALVVGLFGIAEVLATAERLGIGRDVKQKIGRLWPSREDFRRSWGPMGRGTLLGFFIGVVPGTGGIVASFLSYGIEKTLSRRKHEFGKGAVEGLSGPEAANNAAANGSFVPLLTLGIPGNAVVAVILTALIIHGIQPGPRLLVDQADLFWAFVASMYIGNVMLLILNLPLIGLWVSLLRIPLRVLLPFVVMLSFVGVYSVNRSEFDLLVMVIAGVVSYLMRKGGFPVAPLVLAFILTNRTEQSFRQALLISGGDMTTFIQGFMAPAMLTLALAIVAFGLLAPIIQGFRSRRQLS